MSIDWNWGIFLQQAPFGNTTYLGWLWSGFQITVALSISAWIIAFLVGSLFGILRTVPNRFLSGIGTCYVELFRNVPLIVQFFTWYLVVPEFLPENIGMWFKSELDPNIQFFVSSMLCLGLFTAITLAYVFINAVIMLIMYVVERKVRLPGNMGGK
ncbi:ABC transporter permease subunit [Klebsiella pneumoniae]|nr:ABC transporter permease subunit [Klebsiella pneumoniae]